MANPASPYGRAQAASAKSSRCSGSGRGSWARRPLGSAPQVAGGLVSVNLLLAASTIALLGLAGLTAAQNTEPSGAATLPSGAATASATSTEITNWNASGDGYDDDQDNDQDNDQDDDQDDYSRVCVCCRRRAVRGVLVHRGRRCSQLRPIAAGEGADDSSSTVLIIILIMTAMAILTVGLVAKNRLDHCRSPFARTHLDNLDVSPSDDWMDEAGDFHPDPGSPSRFATNSEFDAIHGKPAAPVSPKGRRQSSTTI